MLYLSFLCELVSVTYFLQETFTQNQKCYISEILKTPAKLALRHPTTFKLLLLAFFSIDQLFAQIAY